LPTKPLQEFSPVGLDFDNTVGAGSPEERLKEQDADGCIPYFYQQLDQAYKISCSSAERLLGLKKLDRLPSDYLKEQAQW
jgi:hypothetical protein